MELASTIEISGEEREIADAYAREQIDAINSNLGDYGLNNVFDGVKQGYITVSTGVESDIDKNCVKSIDKKSCKPNDKITIKTEKGMTWIGITFYKSDGTFLSGSEKTYSSKQGYEYASTAPDNSAYYKYYVGISAEEVTPQTVGHIGVYVNNEIAELKSDLSECLKKSDITTNETLIGTFNGKNYYRKLFTGISGSGGSVTVNVGEKIEIYNYYGRAYVYGQSGASAAKYPIPNKNYYIESQNISETSFQLTIPTSSDTRKIDLVIEYTKVDE